jgi:hypothetical protein
MIVDPNLKELAADWVKDFILLQRFCLTTIGQPQGGGEFFKIPQHHYGPLGESILKMLEGPAPVIEHINYWELPPDSEDPLIQASGLKTAAALSRKCWSAGVEQEEGKMIFTPKRFLGMRGERKGYEPIEDKILTTKDFSPINLGKHLMAALCLAENQKMDESLK